MRRGLALVGLLLASCAAQAAQSTEKLDRCFEAAGAKYQLSPRLLRAIAVRESSLRSDVTNTNRDKHGRVLSTDYGIMQINSIHIHSLKKEGVITSYRDLLERPCLNIQTGAWILAKHFKVCGLTWDCLGSYNAGFSKNNTPARQRYAGLIKEILRKEAGL